MHVTLYSYNKRVNSTAVPDAGLDLTEVVLKDPTDILYPVLRITPTAIGSPTVAPVAYNYAHIAKFQRYYFIDNWVYVGGCWEANLSIDALGSWRGVIASTSAFVERAESDYNGAVIDAMFPATDNYSIINTAISAPWTGLTISGGCFILGVISGESVGGRIGAVTYYAMTTAELSSLMQFLFSNNIWQSSSITEVGEGLYKSLFNPFQYIVSCMWMPLALSAVATTSTTVKVGYWDTGVSAHSVSLYVTGVLTANATLPDHPQIARGNYLNFAPYAEYTLYLPPFGVIPLDASFRARGNVVHYDCHIDILTGEATLRVGFRTATGNVAYCTERTALLGVPIQLAQILSDYTHALQTITNPPSSLVGVATATATALCLSAVEANTPKVSTTGATGSLVNFVINPVIVTRFATITGASDNILGKPLLTQRVINTLSGYIKCKNPRISAPCMLSEKTMIEQYMAEGFYYE